MPRITRIFAPGQVSATATGSGRDAQLTLEAQDAELEAVLKELSRATHLQFSAEGEAARQRVTLKVERVPVDDLVQSMERLFHLRTDRQGDHITFRAR
jgi:ferric-dicitrate binding protein FerR (iron transport regulator)